MFKPALLNSSADVGHTTSQDIVHIFNLIRFSDLAGIKTVLSLSFPCTSFMSRAVHGVRCQGNMNSLPSWIVTVFPSTTTMIVPFLA